MRRHRPALVSSRQHPLASPFPSLSLSHQPSPLYEQIHISPRVLIVYGCVWTDYRLVLRALEFRQNRSYIARRPSPLTIKPTGEYVRWGGGVQTSSLEPTNMIIARQGKPELFGIVRHRRDSHQLSHPRPCVNPDSHKRYF